MLRRTVPVRNKTCFRALRWYGCDPMKSLFFNVAALGCAAISLAAEPPTQLSPVTVYSPRVANQSPVATFAMPVSALRYEPALDLQGRNLVEAQADVTIRGGIFENTGFRVGAVTLLDPQTGHYLAELPIAPAMLGAPEILTGPDLTLRTMNATVGAVSYDWRPIATGGMLQLGGGAHVLRRGELYQAASGETPIAGLHVGADVDVAHSGSDGPIPFGDHEFDRVGARFQLRNAQSQTDVFAGYQAKFFGWPNLYTPFNSKESENLETLLIAANHRIDLGAGELVALGAYHRRNKDDYAFNRFAPVGATHPFQHTTWEDGGAVELRRAVGDVVLNARAEMLADFLQSTSLTAGHYHSRTLSKLAVVPEKTWISSSGEKLTVRAGATYDDSNHDSAALAPIAEVAREFRGAVVRHVRLSYVETTQEPTYTALNSSAMSGLFRGNPDLQRERSHNVELSADGLVGGWTTTAAVFARRDRSLVDWTFQRSLALTRPGVARSASPVDVDTTGFEAVARHSWSAVDLVLGYTYLAKDSDYRGAPVDASFYALNYARQRLTAALTVRVGRGFELRMDNVARVQASNVLRTGPDEALLSTVALAFRPESWRRVEFVGQVDNLWNSRFQDVPAVPPTPRTWSVGVTIGW